MPKYISLEALANLLEKLGIDYAFDGVPTIEYPPCDIGDTIYTAFLDKVMQYTVNEIKITTSGTYIGVIGDFEKEFRFSVENLGKTFFLTYEEAEKDIKENKNNE